MSPDRAALLAEKAAVIERHLARVAARLPSEVGDLVPATDAADAVILHLWQAVQVAIDLAIAECVRRQLPAPASYAEAFRALGGVGLLPPQLAGRLARAAGFRNLVAHAYGSLDMARVFRAAQDGPADLRAFLRALRDAG